MNDIDPNGNLVDPIDQTDTIKADPTADDDMKASGIKIGAEKYDNPAEEEKPVEEPVATEPVDNFTIESTTDKSGAPVTEPIVASSAPVPPTPSEVVPPVKEEVVNNEVPLADENAKRAEAAFSAPLGDTIADPNAGKEATEKPAPKKTGFWGKLFGKR